METHVNVIVVRFCLLQATEDSLSGRESPIESYVKVEKVVDHGGAKSFTLVPDTEKGTKNLAYFRAGQYVSVALELNYLAPRDEESYFLLH